MTKFAHIDTKKPDGVYVRFERVDIDDGDATPSDYLFQDAAYRAEDEARAAAWRNNEWHFIGIRARAHITVVSNGTGTMYMLESAGLWGIENDSGEGYLSSVYEEECEALKADLLRFGSAQFV